MNRIRHFLFSPKFEEIIIVVIVANAFFLGIGTMEYMQRNFGEILDFIDGLFVLVFAVELSFKIFFLRKDFFKNGWNIFDLIVVAVPLFSSIRQLSILRSLRILRLMRLLHFIPRFQKIIDSFLLSLPGIAGICTLLLVIFYTFAVMGCALFARDHPQFFGNLGASLFTVFQISTLTVWANIARVVMETHPWSWIYFVALLLATALTVVNLIVTLLIDSVAELREQEHDKSHKKDLQLKDLYKEIQELKKLLKK